MAFSLRAPWSWHHFEWLRSWEKTYTFSVLKKWEQSSEWPDTLESLGGNPEKVRERKGNPLILCLSFAMLCSIPGLTLSMHMYNRLQTAEFSRRPTKLIKTKFNHFEGVKQNSEFLNYRIHDVRLQYRITQQRRIGKYYPLPKEERTKKDWAPKWPRCWKQPAGFKNGFYNDAE